jgi:F-type H+-transporting ATPase subunit gamma
MSSTKEIQRRIKSVKNIKKITKAMEMVAAAKMRKTIETVLRTRPYANLSWMTVLNIADSVNSSVLHPLLTKRKEVKRELIILFAANRGLCGNFNAAIVQKAIASIKKRGHDEKQLTEHLKKDVVHEVDFLVIGKKGLTVKSRYDYNIAAEFPKQDVCYEVKEVRPIARIAIDDFLSDKYDKVLVAYTDFVNAVKQVPRVKQLLPIDLRAKDDHLGVVGQDPRVGLDKEFIKSKEEKYLNGEGGHHVFTYEPNEREVLNNLLPRLIEVQLFQALLESNASEHSARMAAMRQASDAADDLSQELSLTYNKARQAGITREISEIVAGVNALNG